MTKANRIKLLKRVINPRSYRGNAERMLLASIIQYALRDIAFAGYRAGSHRNSMALANDSRFYLQSENCEWDCAQLDIERDGLVGHFLRLVEQPNLQSALDKFNPVN